ncbi:MULTISPECIES: translation initiation factor IF-2 [Flavobacterium]|uniref:Translation initiation factor IF-2 n=1 Tax=Flavobacterium gawalongense TaxID=2594432 RepID=A0A553BXC2_9FLAO|nr:translation initiation factor IF-2 [Flavobacterium gawalongense]TRX04189.1 translation initiation factor IF-2 [Flavobacterium gawalongense]TRX09361.1 translation initiation factor IF-2 [Flavobacterium gawalongense]TRX12825.1 translation initiation factor IF-2 [Flavobacterium gawalongense]TRX13170.1 translation initiation factor IF-2 [Flavobacterium gawalongense]TRX30768.1 translation initiation factor IF-2 [Flavobacterium gawalongense]
MSEERIIRINKVLRELNISLERAVDYLKDKGIAIEANPNTKISDDVYNVLCGQFAGDKGNKEASKEVGEEKKKEKEALRLEREKEIEDKRKIEEERLKQQEVIKARAVIAGPVQVGKIDLNPKKAIVVPPVKAVEKIEIPAAKVPEVKSVQKEVSAEKPSPEKPLQEKVVSDKKEVKPVVGIKEVKTEAVKEVAAEPKVVVKTEAVKTDEAPVDETITTQYQKLSGTTLTGQIIDLSQFNKPKKKKEEPKITPNKPGAPGSAAANANKNKRKRIAPKPGAPRPPATPGVPGAPNPNKITPNVGGGGFNANRSARPGFVKGNRPAIVAKVEPTEEEVKNQIRETLEKLQGKGGKSKAAKYRRDKRDTHRQKSDDEQRAIDEGSKTIKVTEFVTVGEIAIMMDVPITKVIGTCMSLGIMVTMNQRLDAETLTIVADEFGYEVEFITVDIEEAIQVVEDREEDLVFRAPIVTVMGHVDHGKTSLLDYIRKENVIAGESGGITQHIGAYGVTLDNGQKIAFLDTPGHEAFTAMRARGAQVTDIAIIVIAADDDIMPQTKEAISHAQAAGVPIIFAINKIDKPNANPEKVKERLAGMNLLVEDWGGKIQSHDISAKVGTGVKELLEKVLLEAELLDLKSNPNKAASGTVVEAFLDKGKGYVSTILVQNGTLKIGDYMLAGKHHGKIKAMHDERGNIVTVAGPSTPVSVLGLDGAATAGDKFNIFEDEKEAKQIASKRSQLMREQSVRTQRHITLDEIGRRIALGQFKELNIILKGDVDGSVEALSDSFSKLSTEEIQINIIHKGVGAITETDVMLASASDAIIIGFNVRPAGNARQLADKEEIDIRYYSIIYAAIDDLKDAMEGMLAPEMKEEILGTAEIREIFKISKVGSIAGSMVMDGKIVKNAKMRIIREGVVVFTGELLALKRFKDDVKEVAKGYDCGIQVKGYNDIEERDVIESYHEVAVKKKLK